MILAGDGSANIIRLNSLLQADAALNGSVNLQVICTAMTTRGILQAAECSLSPHGELTVIPPNDQGGAALRARQPTNCEARR